MPNTVGVRAGLLSCYAARTSPSTVQVYCMSKGVTVMNAVYALTPTITSDFRYSAGLQTQNAPLLWDARVDTVKWTFTLLDLQRVAYEVVMNGGAPQKGILQN